MEKNFENWHREKTVINNTTKWLDFKEREIWLCHLGMNIGHEQDGKGSEFLRPAVILRKFGREVFWAVPLIGIKKEAIYYFQFSFEPHGMTTAILSQVRLIDAHRLKRKLGVISEKDFATLKQKFRAIMP